MALDHDARFLVMVGGPIVVNGIGISPGRSRLRSLLVPGQRIGCHRLLHGGNSRYGRYLSDWGETPIWRPSARTRSGASSSANPTQDTFANLLAHGLFDRFPNLRLACIETGADWVFHLFEKLKKSFGQSPHLLPEDPRETFKRHVWVIALLRGRTGCAATLLGRDHILMGSDYPHAEGLADPISYIKDLKNFDYPDADCRLVMRDNGIGLSQRRPA